MKKTFLILLVLLCAATMALSVASAADNAAAENNLSAIDDNAVIEVDLEESDISDSIQADMDSSDDKFLEAPPLKDGASTIYVSTTGDDSKNGLSEENAVATIAKAYELAGNGSTINIAAGTYDQSSSITIAKDVNFVGTEGTILNRAGIANVFTHSASNTISIKGIEFTANSTASNPIVNMGGSGSLTLENCKFHDMNITNTGTNGIFKVFYQSNATFDNCEFYNIGGGTKNSQMYLSILGSGTTAIKNSYFHDITSTSLIRAIIYCSSSDATLNIENSVFSGIGGNMFAAIDKSNGIMSVNNCTFENNVLTGADVRGLVASVGANTKDTTISACSFSNNDVKYAIYDKSAPLTVQNCAFDINEGLYAIGTESAAVTANCNFYGSNDNPSALLDNVTASNWVIAEASASADSVAVGDEITITVDYSKYTDGTTTGDVTGTMANIPVTFANDDSKGSISDIVYDTNKAIVTYTGVSEGDDSVAVSTASYSTTIPITVTAPTPTGTTIYVKEEGNDENNGLSEAAAVKTIARAMEIADAAEGTDFIISIGNGNYYTKTIESLEGKNINLIGEDRDATIIHVNGTYGINVIHDNIAWKIESLTICDLNSTAGQSAALFFHGTDGTLDVNNCAFRNITSKNGAIYLSSNGIVNVSNSLIENIYGSTSSGAASIMLLGSGTYNFDGITITGCDLADFIAGESTGYNLRALIYLNNADPTVSISNSRIINNEPAALSLIESIGVMNIINTTIENNTVKASTSGAQGGQYIIEARNGGNINISQSSIVNNTIARTGKGIFYTYGSYSGGYGIINTEYSVILNNVYSDGTAATIKSGDGTFTLDYNYWGSNDKPNVNVNSWAIITGEAPEYAFVGVADEINVYLSTYNTTDGTTGTLEKTMPEVTLDASYALCPSNPSSVTIRDGVGTIAYTATEAGDETVSLSNGYSFSFEVSADASTLIYVDGSVETSGTGTTDSPFKTIAEALNVAADGKTIIIRSGTYTEKDLVIDDDIIVKAEKNAVVIIDANNEGRIFIVTSSASIKDLTLINAKSAANGGAIFVNGGNLSLSNVNIKNSEALNGGAIATSAGSELSVSSSSFTDNNATNGGAIYVETAADVSITSNSFDGNTATKGEAIYIKDASVSLSGNTIADNEVIYLESGSVNSILIFLSNSTITGEPGQEITLTATLTDDKGNAIRGGSVVFTANGETIETVDLSGSAELQIAYTVPDSAEADITISGSYTLGRDTIVATGAVHPAIPNWFIEGGSGFETLAEAIAAAENGDVIYGRPGTYTVNGITVSKDITIKANETGTIVLDGGKSKMFTVGSLTTLTLLNLDLSNGGSSGGGFATVGSTGVLNILNSTLRDLKPTSAGGAISVTSGGKVNIEGSRFENISASGSAAVLSATGASSVITIKDSSFDNINNTQDYTLMQIAGNLSLEGSNFTNIVGKYQSNWYGAVGLTSSANAYISECQFINVTGGDGSAIYFNSGGNLTVTKSVFMNNKNYRGAIYVNNPSSANINYNLFIDNIAGGSYAKDVYKNNANAKINANYNFWGTNSQPTASQITDAADAAYWTIVDLSASSDTVYMGTTAPIDVKFVATNGNEKVALEDSMPEYSVELSASAGSIDPAALTITNNEASASYTPASQGTATITAAPAGAELVLKVVDPSVLLVVSTAGNDETGAGTFDNPYATIAHALSQVTETRNVIYLAKTENDYKEHGITLSGNVIIKAEEKTVTIDGENAGIIFVVTGTASIEGLTLINGNSDAVGGAIFVNGGSLNLANVEIKDSTALNGGAIATSAGSSLTVTDSAFSGNKATNGGAIYVTGEADIASSEFRSNNATNGGAIYIDTESDVNISSNTFNSNEATLGEAIYSKNAPLNLSGNTISDNEVIYLESGSVNSVLIFLTNSTVNGEIGEEITLTATLTDDKGNSIRGGSVVFTIDGETLATVDLSGSAALQTTYTVPESTENIIISGSYSLDNGGVVAAGTLHPAIISWFIEGGSGYETLADAVAAASAGNVIYAKPGTYDLSGITVDKAVTIKANESGSIILNGNGNQIFNIKANVVLDNLTFINGSATSNGGLIYVTSGTLSINNSVFKDSEASSGQGSAIYVASGAGNIAIDNSAFDNIKAYTALINCRSTSTVFTVTKTNFTNIDVSTNGIFYLYEGGIRASESQFINITGGEGAAVYFYGQSNNIITKCVFDNVTTANNGIIYSNGKTANVSYNVFLGVNKGIHTSSSYNPVTADFNYWGTNEQPSDYVNAYTALNNWVVMTVTPSEIEAIEIDTTQEFIVDFKHYTDGTAVSELADSIPELTVSASAVNGALDQSEIETVENQATFTYTANVAGEDTVTFTNAAIALPVTFNVSLDPIGVIFVANNGTATGTGSSDDPVNSIARAIELANEAKGKIYIQEGVYTETNFTVSKDLEITGLGNVVIDANNVNAKMFNIGSDVSSFVLKNVEITKVSHGFGGVLYNNYGADVVFNNVSINESYANGYGNAALIINKGNLTIIDSNMSDNGPTTCLIYNDGGNVTIDNSVFENNVFNTSSTTFGIVYSNGNATISVEDSKFTNIDSIRGTIYSKNSDGGKLNIANSIFENCSASFENNFGYGGAVYSEAPVNVSDSTFINSKSYKDGAAIYAGKGGEITNSVFSGGVSEDGDTSEIYTAGDLALSNNVFSAPSSDKYVVKAAGDAAVNANDNWFGSNNATAAVSGFVPNSWVIMTVEPALVENVKIGDAVEISIDFKHTNNTEGVIGDFTGNLAEITVYASANNGTFATNPVTTSDLEAKIIYAPEYGGENIVYINSESKDKVPVTIMVIEPYLGPIYVSTTGSASGNGTEENPVNSIAKAVELAKEGSGQIIILEGTYSENNIAIDGDNAISIIGEGDVLITGTGLTNASIFNITAKDVSIKGIAFTNNVARNGAAIRVAGRNLNNLMEVNLTIEDCTFDGLNSTSEGGAIFGEYLKGSFVINNCTFKNNFINSSRGAGIYIGYSAYVDALDLVINNTSFVDNFANNAAAHLAAEHITIENCNFTNNTAKYYPGALNIYNSTVSINNCIFADNKGSKNAAAIYIEGIKDQPRRTTSINNTIIENNGGVDAKIPAIYVITDELEIENSIIVNEHNIETGTTSSYGGITGQGVVVANNNWWGTHDPSALVNGTNITIDKWVIMSASSNASDVLTGEAVEITVDFKHTNSTDGTIAAFEGSLPKELTVVGTVNNGTLSPTEVTTSDLEAKFTFTPEFKGENIVSISCGNEAIPVAVNVKLPQKATSISADEEITVEFGSGSLDVSLSAEGSPVEGKVISLKVNDEITLTGTTNAQGIASIDLSTVPLGTYSAEIRFEEEEEYLGSSASIAIIVVEPPKTSADLQKAIDETPEGGVLNLSNIEFVNVSGINITKDIAIVGDNLTINTAGDGTPVFNIASNISNVSISGVEFVANNGDVLIKATASNGTDDLSIVNPAIEIANNTVTPANENVVPSSITLFELEAERAVLAPSNEISIKDNNLPEGAKAFDFAVAGLNNGSDVSIPKGGNINTNGSSGNASTVKQATRITAKNIKTTTVNTKINGKKAGKNFSITLKDSNGNVLAGKEVLISFNGKIYKRTTDAKGVATVKVALSKKGTYPVVVSFLGDDNYNGSFVVAKVKVNPQKVKLTVAKKKYKASKKTKVLKATLKATNKKAIKGKKIVFIVNKKKYTAKTNKKGIAKVKVKLSRKKTYKVTVKFAGDSTFKKATKKSKVKIV